MVILSALLVEHLQCIYQKIISEYDIYWFSLISLRCMLFSILCPKDNPDEKCRFGKIWSGESSLQKKVKPNSEFKHSWEQIIEKAIQQNSLRLHSILSVSNFPVAASQENLPRSEGALKSPSHERVQETSEVGLSVSHLISPKSTEGIDSHFLAAIMIIFQFSFQTHRSPMPREGQRGETTSSWVSAFLQQFLSINPK